MSDITFIKLDVFILFDINHKNTSSCAFVINLFSKSCFVIKRHRIKHDDKRQNYRKNHNEGNEYYEVDISEISKFHKPYYK